MIKHIMPLTLNITILILLMKTIKEAVFLAKRYLKERKLPDSAIDLIDRTMASIKIMDEVSKESIQELKNTLESLIKEKTEDPLF